MLLVDDDLAIQRVYGRILGTAGYQVETASDGAAAAEMARSRPFDVIVSDIAMPRMTGMQLLRAVREHNADLPVVLVTGAPAVDTAAQAVEYGALRYLVKPVDEALLLQTVERAVRLNRMARIRREALAQLGGPVMPPGDRAALEASFERALGALWVAVQPIVSLSARRVVAYEALVRSDEPTFPNPGVLLDAAERLGRLGDIGRAVRDAAVAVAQRIGEAELFVNLHATDLLDESLYRSDAGLARVARRVVLEITERAALDGIRDLRARVAALRAIGYRIALDDLGAGYSGLSSFAQLEPEVVKLDMSLVREVDCQPVKRKLVESMTRLCQDMGLRVVAEGVETGEERDALLACGCDLMQGFYFAKPAREVPTVAF